MTQRALAVASLLSLALMSGCMAIGALSVSGLALTGQVLTSRSEDVSQYDEYKGHRIWQSYSRGGVYELKRDIFYGKLYSNRLNLDELFRPAALVGTVPKSIDSYRADPTKWPSVKGVVPAGTKLRVRRVVYMQDLNVHDFYYIAYFDEGPVAGQEVVINNISISNGLGIPRLYDSDLLEPVSGR